MELESYILQSSLDQTDKDFWALVLPKLDEAQTKIMTDFIDNNEDNLNLITENIKAKKAAFESGDEKALEEIINQEK